MEQRNRAHAPGIYLPRRSRIVRFRPMELKLGGGDSSGSSGSGKFSHVNSGQIRDVHKQFSLPTTLAIGLIAGGALGFVI